jgi:hypothetical protein
MDSEREVEGKWKWVFSPAARALVRAHGPRHPLHDMLHAIRIYRAGMGRRGTVYASPQPKHMRCHESHQVSNDPQRRTCSPSLAKFAERMDGATIISSLEQRSTLEVAMTFTAQRRALLEVVVGAARSAFLVIVEDCIAMLVSRVCVGERMNETAEMKQLPYLIADPAFSSRRRALLFAPSYRA